MQNVCFARISSSESIKECLVAFPPYRFGDEFSLEAFQVFVCVYAFKLCGFLIVEEQVLQWSDFTNCVLSELDS